MHVVSSFLECDGKILFVLRKNVRTKEYEWDLPAGKVRADESLQDAIVRIVKEEVGYEPLNKNLIPAGEFPFVSGNGEPYTMVTYIQKLNTPLNATSGALKSKWMTPEELQAQKNLIKNLLKLMGWLATLHSAAKIKADKPSGSTA